MTKSNYEILGVSIGATQEEIAKAYKKMALKYHPDRNRGNEEWAKKKFIEVGEAYSVLSGKEKSGSSNRFSSDDEFKKFEEMLKEVERKFKETEKEFYEYEENNNRKDEAARSKVTREIEETLTLSNVSISELDSSLWSPYGNWKEKVENSVGSDIDIFSGDMRIAINKAKWKKVNDNNSKSEQGGYNRDDYSRQNWQNPQQPKGNYGGYGNPQSDFSNKDFSPNNSGSTGEQKPFSTQGDEITRLKREIKYNKDYILMTPHEDEKEKCRKIVARLEEKLRKLQTPQPNPSGSFNSSNSDFGVVNNDNDKKDEKIKKLEDEIGQLKKISEGRWNSRQKKADQKKIAEKEQELSELKKDNKDNGNDELNEQLINKLINEIERLRGESKDLKNEKDELAKKVSQLEKIVERLERETQELRKEIEELKEGKDDSSPEYRSYMINKKNDELQSKQAMVEKLKGISNPSSNPSSNFPTGWVVGGVVLAVVGLLAVLIAKKCKKKKIKWKKVKK